MAKTLDELLSAMADDQLTPQELATLSEQLRSDPQARSRYVEWMELHAQLEWEYCRAAPSLPLPSAARAHQSWRVPGTRWRVAAMVALTLGGFWAAWLNREHGTMARIEAISEAVWREDSIHPQPGDRLAGGVLRLTSGSVQLRFAHDVLAVLSGPAELELLSDSKVFLHQGRLVPRVPKQGRGFTVMSPGGKVIDLGTEFSLGVDAAGNTDLHVIDGQVEVAPKSGPTTRPQRLNAGYGAELRSDHPWQLSQVPWFLDTFGTQSTQDLNAQLETRQNLGQVRSDYVQLNPAIPWRLQPGALQLRWDSTGPTFEAVSGVALAHNFQECVGKRYTVSFLLSLSPGELTQVKSWAAFVLSDEPPQRPGAKFRAYEPEAALSLLLARDFRVGIRRHGENIVLGRKVFPHAGADGPFMCMIRIDETAPGGPRADVEINGVQVVTQLPVPLGAARHLLFHTFITPHSGQKAVAQLQNLRVSLQPPGSGH